MFLEGPLGYWVETGWGRGKCVPEDGTQAGEDGGNENRRNPHPVILVFPVK